REMVKRSTGCIINMSSVMAVMAIANQTAYNVSKGGIRQLTRNMALALADKGVRVNAIGPGTILTELTQTIMTDDEARRNILSRTPMGRFGDVDEVARIAVFLATEDSSYITGQTIYCDGGRMTLNYVMPAAN
ncbi:MAG: SDR family oxidoreductase, partial [Alphaproteobacteria bacterium]